MTKERQLEARAARAVSLLVAAAVTIYPAWTVFDFLLTPEWWRVFAVLRFAQAGAIAGAWALWRRSYISTNALAFVSFCGMAVEIAFMCAVVSVDVLTPYFLGFSTLFLAVGVVVLWPCSRAILVLAAAVGALVGFNEIFELRSATTLIEHGGLMFLTLATVSVLVCRMRWQMVGEEIDARLRIEATHLALERQTERLVTSNRELDRFARTVSHDLKTPINKLSMALSILEDPSVDDAERKAMTRDMRRFIESAARTIDELLDAAHRKETGAASDRVAVVGEIYGEIEDLLGDEIRSVGGRAVADFSECSRIAIDRSKLKSILLNLMTNALKYRSPDRPLEIRLSTARANGAVALSVADNGRGIDLGPREGPALPTLTRAHPEIPGSGLGLRFVKDAVEAEGGRIEVESQLDRGTTFRVWLREAPPAG